ncbi:MAG TPA: ABC transporter ATP-binding protein [Polyangiaceae bacterium]|nr:ABC transporter ATP-binding protein [Polyangiaceae bacterium]
MSPTAHRASGATVRLQNVYKEFGDRQVLRGIDLEVPPGKFLAIVGRSGSGKSTVLRLLCGLDDPTRGSTSVVDPSGNDVRGSVRVVFQEPRLLPWRSVLSNVSLGARRTSNHRAREVLGGVGLADRLHEYPGVLSGGERQRVALARALVHEPAVMLLDEPFAALDALTRIGAQRLVESLWMQHGFTALLVTHDVEEAVLLGDYVVVLDEGRVIERVEVNLTRPRARERPEIRRLTARLLDAILSTPRQAPPAVQSPDPSCKRDFSEFAQAGAEERDGFRLFIHEPCEEEGT